MNPFAVPNATSRLVVPLVRFRNRSTRHGELSELPLGEVFGFRPEPREDERGAPCFSVAVMPPGGLVRQFHALVLAYALDADQAFLLDRALRGRAHVSWTAFDHRADGADSYRFRVLFPLSRAVNAHDYAVLAQAIDSDLGGLADLRAERRDRRWSLPTCHPDREEFAGLRYGPGSVIEVDEVLGYRLAPSELRYAG